jgi:hypothetical protein
VKQYLGHAAAHGGVTDLYAENMVPYMPIEHRALVEHLPSPQQVERMLATFEPVDVPKTPRKRRRKRDRSVRTGGAENLIRRGA